MQIKSLKISGYKNLNIDLKHETDIIAAIGNNGSGKSNLLEAFCRIFGSLYDKSSVDFTYEITFVNTENKTIRVKKEKTKKAIMFVNDVRQIAMENYLPQRIIVIYSGEEDRLWRNCIEENYKKYIANINKSATRGTNVMTELLPAMLYLNKFYWHIALLSIICSDSDDNKTFVKNILKIDSIEKIKFDFKKGNYDNYTNSEILRFIKYIDVKTEYTIDEFKQVLGTNNYNADDVFKYLYTSFTPISTKILDDITIVFNDNLTIEDLSEGEKKLLLIKASLEFAGQEDCLFILDEPDAHIHVSNKEEIIKMFNPYKHNRQIVFTTHSPTLTNCLDDSQLYMLDCGELMEKEKQAKLNHLIGDSWNRHEMGAFLANKKNMILLVEGKHDKIHIETAFHKLKEEYPTLDFAIYSIGGEDKIRPLMTGLYEAGDFKGKTYIAIYDNDKAGVEAINKGGFDRNEANRAYRKLRKDKKEHNNFFAVTLPKPSGSTNDCTIENLFDASRYEEAYKEAVNKTLGHFANKPISGIHEDIICKSKNILAEKSKDFVKEDFKHFRPVFDLLLEIQNKQITNDERTQENPAETTIQNEKTKEKTNYYFLEARGVKAKGYLLDESKIMEDSSIIVCKDAEVALNEVSSCPKSVVNMRNQLIEERVLKLVDAKYYIFTQDYTFNSVSTAGSVILGQNTNGWKMWKDEKGNTLKILFRKGE
ncbi:MAG: DUF4357 domain-containing protein [Prevotella sp.]|jgi:predicted ATPase|nr:DUF4357 domain-containing protein [Prevotella sp.]